MKNTASEAKCLAAACVVAAIALTACGSSTSSPSQPAVAPPPSQSTVSPSPSSAAPSTTADPTPAPTTSTDRPPVATPAPTARPTPKPTPRPTERPFSRAERYLMGGIQRAKGVCSPVRGGALPGLAIAGIDCDLHGSPAARMGYYLFKNDADMLDAYMARMSVEGVVIDSGACAPGEGESAFIPSAENETAPDRHACFVNDAGYGNYRATLSGYHVYLGLLGRSADMRSLEDWAWLGNEDTPGYPTLWRQDSAYRP